MPTSQLFGQCLAFFCDGVQLKIIFSTNCFFRILVIFTPSKDQRPKRQCLIFVFDNIQAKIIFSTTVSLEYSHLRSHDHTTVFFFLLWRCLTSQNIFYNCSFRIHFIFTPTKYKHQKRRCFVFFFSAVQLHFFSTTVSLETPTQLLIITFDDHIVYWIILKLIMVVKQMMIIVISITVIYNILIYSYTV